jgi:choline dehydrogenase-like flavoprotein
MITVELVTIAHVPPFAEVTLRTNLDGWQNNDLAGQYRNDRWVFELTDPKYQAGFLCKFALGRKVWSNDPDISISGTAGQHYTFYLREIGFQAPVEPVVELGQVQTKLFDIARPIPESRTYDVIVIGSGMAGGVLADRLADRGAQTLVLEAGGVPLETHIANLPRPQYPGEFRKHVWERWFEYRVVNYDQPADGTPNDYGGAQGFNLGGRSVFWGGFIPRMSSWELDFWPKRLKWDLEDRYYQLAEDLMGRSTAPTTYYTQQIHRLLRTLLPRYSHFDAPVAVRLNPAGANTITTGLFSTADLLLESVRSRGTVGSQNLTIRTHHQVIGIEAGQPCAVVARDTVSKEERRFRAAHVVLACGCLESARLAKRSGLGNDLVGQGVTDHPIAFTHFAIPPTSPYYDRFGSVKVLSQPVEPRPEEARSRDPFNVLIELGADFNQGRYLDEDIFQEAIRKRDMLCEIVFLTNTELVLSNRLEFAAGSDFRPVAKIRNPGLPAPVLARVNEITDTILDILQGQRLNQGNGAGGVGGVAHEVGSLRMEVQTSNNVEKGIQAPLAGVVNEDGKFLDQEFVYACDLSVFPTSPAANPSLTAVALALRLADHLIARL